MRLPESVDTPLRTAVSLLVLPPALAFYSVLGTVLALLGAPQRRVHIAYYGYARLCLRVGATRLEVSGLDRLKPGQAYVVVSNHQSTFDIMAHFLALPFPIRFLAKKELFGVPLLGWALRRLLMVPVDRYSAGWEPHPIGQS